MALYVKLDTNWLWNRHMVTVGPFGRLLYIGGLSYCGENLSDGRIPKAVLNRIADVDDPKPTKSAQALVEAGRWDDAGDCWMVHDYQLHQTTSAQVEAKRERWRNQKRNRKVESITDSTAEQAAESHVESRPESVKIPPTRTQNTEHRTQIEEQHSPQTADAAGATKAPRARDDLFDALAEHAEGTPIVRQNTMAKRARRAVAVAAAEIRTAGGTPDAVPAACAEYRRQFPQATLSANALAKHWHRLFQRVDPSYVEPGQRPELGVMTGTQACTLARNYALSPDLDIDDLANALTNATAAVRDAALAEYRKAVKALVPA